jgi:ABC-type bacteriocin/lantibiotic exporter with double-glycine peptidase domain
MATGFIRQALKHVGEGTTTRPVLVAGRAIYPQRNKWACGPWALRHCLMKWGLDIDPYKLAKLCLSTRAGTGERGVELGALRLGVHCKTIDVKSASEAKRQIDKLLRKGLPLVLSVEKWQHWVACLHHSPRGYLVFDSDRPGPVIQLWAWRKLKKRLRYIDKQGVVHYSVASVQRPM